MKFKRSISMLLATVMVLTMVLAIIPASVFAADNSNNIAIGSINAYGWGNDNYPVVLGYGEGKTVATSVGGNWFTWWYKVKAAWSEDNGAYVVNAVDVSNSTAYEAWTMTADEIILLVYGANAAVYAAERDLIKALVVGDMLIPDGFDRTNASANGLIVDGVSSVNFTVKKAPVPVQPAESVALPEGALKLDILGYTHDKFNYVMYADADTTLGALTEKYFGTSKDLNYFKVVVANADGTITEVYKLLGREPAEGPNGVKTDYAVKAGQFVYAFSANVAGYEAADAYEVGGKIVVYNILLENVAKAEVPAEGIALTNAGAAYVPAPKEVDFSWVTKWNEVDNKGQWGAWIDPAAPADEDLFDFSYAIEKVDANINVGVKYTGTISAVKADATNANGTGTNFRVWFSAYPSDGWDALCDIYYNGTEWKANYKLAGGDYVSVAVDWALTDDGAELSIAIPEADLGFGENEYRVFVAASSLDSDGKNHCLNSNNAKDAGNNAAAYENGTVIFNEVVAGVIPEDAIVISQGKDYTTTAPTRGDGYDDDGEVLTDGSKGNPDGGNTGYAGWSKVDVEVIVDLGEARDTHGFRVYSAGGNWGITTAKNLAVYTSLDGETYTKVDSALEVELLSGDGVATNAWSVYSLTIASTEAISARYVKFVVVGEGGNKFVWIDEVEVLGISNGELPPVKDVTGKFDNDGFNTVNGWGGSFHTIYTAANNEDYTTGIEWWASATLAWNEEAGAWEVIATYAAGTKNRTALEDGQIAIVAHSDGDGYNATNGVVSTLSKLAVGDILYIAVGVESIYAFTEETNLYGGGYSTVAANLGEGAVLLGVAPVEEPPVVEAPYAPGLNIELGEGVTILSDRTPEAAAGLLTDLDSLFEAGAWGTGTDNVVAIQNLLCESAGQPEFAFVWNFEVPTEINKISLGLYHCYMVMIGHPEVVSVQVSADGIEWTTVDATVEIPAVENGVDGYVEAIVNIAEVQNYQYLRVNFTFPKSPFEAKPTWEFAGFTEVSAYLVEDVVDPVENIPVEIPSRVDVVEGDYVANEWDEFTATYEAVVAEDGTLKFEVYAYQQNWIYNVTANRVVNGETISVGGDMMYSDSEDFVYELNVLAGDVVIITVSTFDAEWIPTKDVFAFDLTMVDNGGDEQPTGNLVAGKEYTTSKPYQQGGKDAGWGWDDNAPISYPDESGKDLTDGLAYPATDSFSDAVWVGLHGKTPDVVDLGYAWVRFDLGEVIEIGEVDAYVGSALLGSGITEPDFVEVMISEDGETWTSAGKVEPETNTDIAAQIVAVTVDAAARYVEIRFTKGGWVFVSEIEIWAKSEAVDPGNDNDSIPLEIPSDVNVTEEDYTTSAIGETVATYEGVIAEDGKFVLTIGETAAAGWMYTVTVNRVVDGALTTFASDMMWSDGEGTGTYEFDVLAGDTVIVAINTCDADWNSTTEAISFSVAVEAGAVTPPVDDPGYTVDPETGDASYDSAIGYVFVIDGTDSAVAVAETTRFCTSLDTVGTAWGIYVVLEQDAAGNYVAVTDGTFMAGNAPAVKLEEGQVLLVAHSASSKPAEAELYPNWQDKIALMAVKAGDMFAYDAENNTLTVYEGEPVTPPVTDDVDFSWVTEWNEVDNKGQWGAWIDPAAPADEDLFDFSYAIERVDANINVGIKYIGTISAVAADAQNANGTGTNFRVWFSAYPSDGYDVLCDIYYNGTEWKANYKLNGGNYVSVDVDWALTDDGVELSIAIPEADLGFGENEYRVFVAASSLDSKGVNHCLNSNNFENAGTKPEAYENGTIIFNGTTAPAVKVHGKFNNDGFNWANGWGTSYHTIYTVENNDKYVASCLYWISAVLEWNAEAKGWEVVEIIPVSTAKTALEDGQIAIVAHSDEATGYNNVNGVIAELAKLEVGDILYIAVGVETADKLAVDSNADALWNDVNLFGGAYSTDASVLEGVLLEAATPATPAPEFAPGLNIILGENSTILTHKVEDAIKFLTDNDWLLTAGDWGTGTANVVPMQNLLCESAGQPEFGFVWNFGEKTEFNTITLGLYSCYNVMIGHPEFVSILVSDDGINWTPVDAKVEIPAVAETGSTVSKVVIDLGAQNAQYVGISFTFPESPFEAKPTWEFAGFTEIAVTNEEAAPVLPEWRPGLNIYYGDDVTILGDDKNKDVAVNLLTDGDWLKDAGAWGTGTANVVPMQNLLCLTGGQPQFQFVWNFDIEEAEYDEIKLGLYCDYNVMIGLAAVEGVYVSDDGIDWKKIDATVEIPAVTEGMKGYSEVSVRLAETQTAQYVAISFYFPESPFESKPTWEFAGFTEVSVGMYTEEPVVPADVEGDLNGDGKVNTLDIVRMKYIILGLSTDASGKADVNGDGKINTLDYIALKYHVLGIKTLG